MKNEEEILARLRTIQTHVAICSGFCLGVLIVLIFVAIVRFIG